MEVHFGFASAWAEVLDVLLCFVSVWYDCVCVGVDCEGCHGCLECFGGIRIGHGHASCPGGLWAVGCGWWRVIEILSGDGRFFFVSLGVKRRGDFLGVYGIFVCV